MSYFTYWRFLSLCFHKPTLFCSLADTLLHLLTFPLLSRRFQPGGGFILAFDMSYPLIRPSFLQPGGDLTSSIDVCPSSSFTVPSSVMVRQSTNFIFWPFLFLSQGLHVWQPDCTMEDWLHLLAFPLHLLSFLFLLAVAEVLLHQLAFPFHLHLHGLQGLQSDRDLISSLDVFSPSAFTSPSTITAWQRSYFTCWQFVTPTFCKVFRFYSQARSYFT